MSKKGINHSRPTKKKKPPRSSNLSQAINQGLNDPEKQVIKQLKESDIRWENIDEVQVHLQQLIREFVKNSTSILMSEGVINQLSSDEKVIFVRLRQQLIKDLDSLTSDLEKLKKRHQGKTGRIEDPEEYTVFLDISLRYNSLYHLTMEQLQPVLAELITMIEKSKNAVNPLELKDSEDKVIDSTVSDDKDTKS